MLTPVLEKLILCGKASYNTFVVGGTQKNILNVRKDHFIIITGINYQSMIQESYNNRGYIFDYNQYVNFLQYNLNTQLKVFSKKSNNSFLFRNNFDVEIILTDPGDYLAADYMISPKNSINLDTYLIHESDVSFTFSTAGEINNSLVGITPADSIAYAPPFDYGKVGQIGATPVVLHSVDTVTPDNGFKSAGTQLDQLGTFPGSNLEFVFPVNLAHSLDNASQAISYPIVNVSYVEIKGNPTNIEASL